MPRRDQGLGVYGVDGVRVKGLRMPREDAGDGDA